jgi:hypothetical protein
MAASTDSRGVKSGFRGQKQAFLNQNRGLDAATRSFSTASGLLGNLASGIVLKLIQVRFGSVVVAE